MMWGATLEPTLKKVEDLELKFQTQQILALLGLIHLLHCQKIMFLILKRSCMTMVQTLISSNQ